MNSKVKKAGIVLGTLFVISALSSSPTTTQKTTNPTNTYSSPVVQQQVEPSVQPTPVEIQKPVQPTVNNSDLSNDNYYVNTYGNEVHSPAYSNTVPAGATARCGDGTYS